MSSLAARRRCLPGRPVWRPRLSAIILGAAMWAAIVVSVGYVIEGIANGKVW